MTDAARPFPRRLLSAAWRIAAAVLPLGVALAVAASALPAGDPSDPATLLTRIGVGVVLSILALATVALLVRRADRKPLSYAGLTDLRAGWRLTLTGAALWTAPAVLAFGVLAALGMPLTVTVPAADLAFTVVLLLVAVLLMEALPEEVIFRGYVTAVLGSVTRGWWIIVIQAVIFTLFAALLRQHWDPVDLSLFLSMGIGFGYLRAVTGSIWMPVGFHTAFQTGAQLVLAHDVVFGGGEAAAMLALGVIPFAVGAVLVSAFPGITSPRRRAQSPAGR